VTASPAPPIAERPAATAAGVERTAAEPPACSTRSGRVALVGLPNVGKSTLLNALLGERIAIVSPHPQTTRVAVRGVLTKKATQYVFVDTPGVHAPRTRLGRWMNDVARQAARDADVLVLVAEVPRDGFVGASEADLALASELPNLPTVLVLSKVDRLVDKARLLPLIAAFAETRSFAATIPLSAKRKDGIERLLEELALRLPEQPWLFEANTLSDQPERFFVAELVREQVLRHTRQEVPHGVAVVVERFDESVKPPRILVAIVVAREAHTKILVGAGGRTVKKIGTAARARVERMLGTRVHLDVHVRAAPDWMNDPARLRDLGYGRHGAGPDVGGAGAASSTPEDDR
jgi:GTPase